MGNLVMMLTPLQLPSVYHNTIPTLTDVHAMLKRTGCEKRIWSTKRSQGKLEDHLYQRWASRASQTMGRDSKWGCETI